MIRLEAVGPEISMSDQARLIQSLRNPELYGSRCKRVTLLETHISYVLLTGEHAYKIKKAVGLDFLDFTTLDGRRFFCDEELRLNRRLAPALYLAVVPITGSVDHPMIGGTGPVLEYAIKMREFRQDALLTDVLAREGLNGEHLDRLARTVAGFHERAAVARSDSGFGTPGAILQPALENFTEMRPLLVRAADRATLNRLRAWTEREHAARAPLLADRKRAGFVRECHGDLHLGNIALMGGETVVFDCIEFNEQLRWIDVMSDVAFLVMDLEDRKRADLALRFLNTYLEVTGDYAGAGVLRFYLAYRAMVRAKVSRLRAGQVTGERRAASLTEYRDYLALARRYAAPSTGGILITHGPAGCGKTTCTQALLEIAGAIRIRTDVERKRLHGLQPESQSGSAVASGLYTERATERTYHRAAALARHVVSAGYVAIVDGAFLRRWQRDLLRKLARELDVPFVILDCSAGEATSRRRVIERFRRGVNVSEADTAVLDHQLRTLEPIGTDERPFVESYDAEAPLDASRDITTWQAVFERLGITVTGGPETLHTTRSRCVLRMVARRAPGERARASRAPRKAC